MLVTNRHHSPENVITPTLAPQWIDCGTENAVGVEVGTYVLMVRSTTMARNTATLMPKITWVRPMLDSPRLTQGLRMTGCGASSGSSPRCAASYWTHHW